MLRPKQLAVLRCLTPRSSMAVRLQWQSVFNGNSVARSEIRALSQVHGLTPASQDLKNIFADNSGPDAAD
jgi:hypothetical protein